MQDFVNKRKKVLEPIQGIARFAKSQNQEDLYDNISCEMHYLEDGKIKVVLIGTIKHGKSSLINALLAEGFYSF